MSFDVLKIVIWNVVLFLHLANYGWQSHLALNMLLNTLKNNEPMLGSKTLLIE